MHQLTTAEEVNEDGSYLFTAEDPYGDPEEVVVVPCEDGVDEEGGGLRVHRRGAEFDVTHTIREA